MAKKKLSALKRIIIICSILATAQGIFWFAFSTEETNPRDWLDETISQKRKEMPDLTPQRAAQLKVQLAVTRYQSDNNGKPPPALEALIPTYFDQVPIDPTTREPFAYKVEGGRAFVGSTAPVAVAKAGITDELVDLEEATSTEKVSFIYDPTGKRDPFRAFDFSARATNDAKSPLERYDLGQLKLTAVLLGMGEPTAIVENSVGKGFTVKKGSKIGTNNGEVVEILQDKVLILESNVDFTGQTATRTVEMKLRTKDQDDDK